MRCTNSAVGDFGRNLGRGAAFYLTLGASEIAMLGTKDCRGCGHKLSLHQNQTITSSKKVDQLRPAQNGSTTEFGFLCGAVTDHGDGSATYQSAVSPASFRVRIADVVGFSATEVSKWKGWDLAVLGRHGELSSVRVQNGVSEKIEAWFRTHPLFNSGHSPVNHLEQSSKGSVADELMKLAALRESGVLTEDEFAVQKSKLLG
jgi:hypothetical protein